MNEYLNIAKNTLHETDGTHDIRWVNCKAFLGAAWALVAIAHELKELRKEIRRSNGKA